MPTLASIADMIRKRRDSIKEKVAEDVGVSKKEVDAALPGVASTLRGAAVAQKAGEDVQGMSTAEMKSFDPAAKLKQESAAKEVAQQPEKPAVDPNAGLDNEEKITLALIGTVPTLLGYALGGNQGGAVGAQATATAAERVASGLGQEKKEKFERAQKQEEIGLKKREVAATEKRAESDAEKNVIEAMKSDQENQIKLAGLSTGKKSFENLPEENKQGITHLAQKNANTIAIANQIDNTIKIFDDPKIPEEQKVVVGKQLIKTLNSTQGADAVGTEEAKRLGSFLEVMPWGRPGWSFGRQVEKFRDQAALTANTIKDTVRTNEGLIAQLKTGAPMSVPSNVALSSAKPKGQEGVAYAAPAPAQVPTDEQLQAMSEDELMAYLGKPKKNRSNK